MLQLKILFRNAFHNKLCSACGTIQPVKQCNLDRR